MISDKNDDHYKVNGGNTVQQSLRLNQRLKTLPINMNKQQTLVQYYKT